MKVGVVGAGAMGSGIAQVAAQSGHQVVLFDQEVDALQNSRSALVKVLNRLVEKSKLTEEEAVSIQARIRYAEDLREMAGCELVIEAIVENLDVKKMVFQRLEEIIPEDAMLTSNTSSLSIASLAAGLKYPQRVFGIHFFNPAPLMPLVEIIPAISSDMEMVQAARSLVDSWGKTTVLAKDTPGFIVNRIARPFYAEAVKMLDEGVADAATIDWAMKTLGGFKMGPFELMDLIGHDVNYVVSETVWTQMYFDPRYRPSLTQKRMMEAGLLGRKTGRGFYSYAADAPAPSPNENEELGQYILQRILAMLINEAYDAVFLGIASERDVELAMTKGVNYPKGLIGWGKEIGLANVLSTLDALHQRFGDDRYRASALLRDQA
ncbi:MAG: 3-hydroxybutyryl-CoA dehydrogenase [Flavobacteriales bacterium]|nr:MAG: 3-hydroxybutyryl-CoA dehydrogenase [Flavobacteriales bacterium]